MRAFLSLLTLLAVMFAGCRGQAPGVPLAIYIVSEEKIEGGRFIDTPEFPKLGYIGPKPDLLITSLEEVETLTITSLEAVGTNTSGQPGQPRPGVIITLRDRDAQKFAALSEKAIMKKTLLMVGDTPLIAPTVTNPAAAARWQRLQFTFPTQADQTKIERDLRKLAP